MPVVDEAALNALEAEVARLRAALVRVVELAADADAGFADILQFARQALTPEKQS